MHAGPCDPVLRGEHADVLPDGAFPRAKRAVHVDVATGLKAVEALRPLVASGETLTQLALGWILTHAEVTCAIPGARRVEQVEENVRAAHLEPLRPGEMAAIRDVYDRHVRSLVHHSW